MSKLLLSSELLETHSGQIAATLYLAKKLYPDLFADADAEEALRLLREETGSATGGIFAYAEGKES